MRHLLQIDTTASSRISITRTSEREAKQTSSKAQSLSQRKTFTNKEAAKEELKQVANELHPQGENDDAKGKLNIRCEHFEGCKKEFTSLKQYFKHHNYYFAYCREDKRHLKDQIRLVKGKHVSCLSEFNGLKLLSSPRFILRLSGISSKVKG